MTEDNLDGLAKEYLIASGYPLPFISTAFMPLLLWSLLKQKHSPDTKDSFREEYDYVIVGAGTAGSVVASRLSEEACVSVLLLEAGRTSSILTDVPALQGGFFRSDIDWNYFTEPQNKTGRGQINRSLNWNSGKVIGGSSVLNSMLYVRGNRKVYDEDWAGTARATGWGYDDLLPYFMRLENNSNPEFLNNGFHAEGGPVSVEQPRYTANVKEPLREAARELRYKFVDSNAATKEGFYDYQATMRVGRRCSSAKAYLVPAEKRPNLDILEKAMVTKLLFDDQKQRCVGVRFDWNGQSREVRTRREVILSAGAVGSPKLLMLSGIGPKEHLKELNIPLIADLQVGDSMQDHVAAIVFLSLDATKVQTDTEVLLNPLNQLDYIYNRRNRFAGSTGGPFLSFLKFNVTDSEKDDPDFELLFVTGPDIQKTYFNFNAEFTLKVLTPYTEQPYLMCLSMPLRPKSRGYLRLNSTNAYDHPIIQPNYYQEQQDMQIAKDGIRTCRKLCAATSMQALGCKEFDKVYPGCEQYVGNEDDYLTCMVETIATSCWHPSCTAKMGDPEDRSAVVDPQLRVKGVTGLRVVDASIMPTLIAGNPDIPVTMIAEKGSDLIRQHITCDKRYQGQYGVRHPPA